MMQPEQVFRLILYAIGVVTALVVAVDLVQLHRHRITRAFAFVMVAWAVNAGMFFVLLLGLLVLGTEHPAWRGPLLTVNATLIAVAPTIVLIVFWRSRRNGL